MSVIKLYQINIIETDNNITIAIQLDVIYVALAEVSMVTSESWYFNRLSVPVKFRNQGIATQLMRKLIQVLDKNKITLICDINPYGDLDFNQLNKFYKQYGFVEHEEHHLIRYPKEDKNSIQS